MVHTPRRKRKRVEGIYEFDMSDIMPAVVDANGSKVFPDEPGPSKSFRFRAPLSTPSTPTLLTRVPPPEHTPLPPIPFPLKVDTPRPHASAPSVHQLDVNGDETQELSSENPGADSQQKRKGKAKVNHTIVRCRDPLPSPSNTLCERWRCYDCFACPHLCAACALSTHRLNPFHRLWKWNRSKRFWEKTTTAQVGLQLYGGRHGKPCPSASRSPRNIVFVHEHGVSRMPFLFCECPVEPGSPELATPEAGQLLELGLFPGSWKEPRTAFTVGLLKAYQLLSLQTHCSAEDFYMYLKRTTDNVAPDSVPDRYRELMMSSREWAFLRACKRAGEPPRAQMPRRSLTVICPCCPQPGINMRPNWFQRDPRYAYLDALFYSIDGNYRLCQRHKAMDLLDVALTRALGYFSDIKDFVKYVLKIGKPEVEASTCHKFGAMGYNGHSGKVSGIVALACRHMFMLPGSIVDLNKAEAYTFVDFAVASGMQPYLGLRLLKQSYDISCQYLINLAARFARWGRLCPKLPSISSLTLPRIEGYVGSWHVNAHKEDCRIKQSPAFLPGSGRYEGEGMERIWAITNDVATRTKEMTSGHRHDVLNDVYSDINVRRVHSIATTLSAAYKDAQKHLDESAESLQKLEATIPAAKLAEWKKEEAKWLELVVDIANHKTLDNPFSPPGETALSEEATATLLRKQYAAKSDSASASMVGAVQGMIEIERERLALVKAVREADPSKTRQRNALGRRVEALRYQAEVCTKHYERFVGVDAAAAVEAVRNSAHPPSGDSFPERDATDDIAQGLPYMDILQEIRVQLPSGYHSAVRQRPEMARALEIERRLREGQATDALNDLRAHLTALFSLQDLRQQGAGQQHGTRIKGYAATEVAVGRHARDEYRRVRHVLRILGMPDDHKVFRVLTDQDAKPFVVFSEQHRRGDSRRHPSWLWEDFSFIAGQTDHEVRAFMMHKLRPHWFRCRAAKARWEEEVNIKKEEMYRSLRFFEYHQERWTRAATEAEEDGRLGAATYARRQADRHERLLKSAQCMYPAGLEKVRQIMQSACAA
ncbi:hypothetical protein FKP32DRAFT_1609054 [Trametes sanguinea]|nr:hypothetical protein FKP32DRAFT_1609054 [Trametes sanguinea]